MSKHFLAVAAALLTAFALSARGSGEAGTGAASAPKLYYWGLTTNPAVSGDQATNPFCQEVRKRTGLDIRFEYYPPTNAQEQFNLLMVSGNLPDIIEWDWLKYPGGPGKAIDEKLIISLNALIGKGAFPHLMAYMKAHPLADKMIKMDNGTYYVVPMIRDGDPLLVSWGPIFRRQFLEKTGMTLPETVDEWEAVLKAFRDKLGLKAPLVLRTKGLLSVGNEFVSAYGAGRDFLVKDGRVVYGPLEPGFREFLKLWSRWYAEGLIDRDVATADDKIAHAKILSDEAGALFTYVASGVGAMVATRKNEADFALVAAKYPVLRKGEIPFYSQKDLPYTSSRSGAISTSAKSPETAAKLLDFFFSEQGRLVKNFGVEGVSYNMVGGYPTFTDLVKKDATRTFGQMLDVYTRMNGPGPQDVRMLEQYTTLPTQLDAMKKWSVSDVDRHLMPPVSFTQAESSRVAAIMSDVKAFFEETYLKVFLGTEPIDKWDRAVEQMRKMGIDEAVGIYNAAYARFQGR